MAHQLDDGTIIPSYMGVSRRGVAEDTGILSNTSLRIGEVKELVYPDQPESITKRFIEYTVEVQFKDGYSPGTTTIYHGCLIANLFGGMGDIFSYTLRSDQTKQTQDDGVGQGSKVLLLCVNGETTKAVIIGGVRDTKTDTQSKDQKDSGHNLFFEFNGLSTRVNKDGELLVKFRGATDIQGKLLSSAPEDAQPTTLEIRKDGSFEIQTKDAKQFVRLDHKNNKIEVQGGTTITVTTKDNVFIKSAGVHIGGATDDMMLGTTVRKDWQQLNQKLNQGFSTLASQVAIAGASLTTASSSMLIPITGPITAAPLIATAGANLTAMVATIGQMVAALTSFEIAAQAHLSKKNKLD